MRTGPAAYASGAAVAAVTGALVAAWAWTEPSRLALTVAGIAWTAMALPTVLAGAWMARVHGQPSALFVVAMGVGLAVRLMLAPSVCVLASLVAPGFVNAALVGLVAGFVPATVFEMVWFVRADRARGFSTGVRG